MTSAFSSVPIPINAWTHVAATFDTTWEAWEEYGNVSSATVFFVLRTLAERYAPADGTLRLQLAQTLSYPAAGPVRGSRTGV